MSQLAYSILATWGLPCTGALYIVMTYEAGMKWIDQSIIDHVAIQSTGEVCYSDTLGNCQKESL